MTIEKLIRGAGERLRSNWLRRRVQAALRRPLRRRSRSVGMAHAVMSKARQLEIVRLRAAALGDRQQVVDLQQMGRAAAAPGDRITIPAASSVALPDVAPDSSGDGTAWRRPAWAVE